MTETIKIKQADIKDLEVLALLGRLTWIETFSSLFKKRIHVQEYADENFSIETIKSFIDNPNAYFWIAYVNDLPIGYAKIEMNVVSDHVKGKNVCKLINLYVFSDFHSKKIGRLLWSNILNKVNALDCDKMWLAVLSTNIKAINFYLKNDFYNDDAFDLNIGDERFVMNIMVKDFKNK
ncbi:GNAT family N-acetyltransferase [Psychroserpens damuponensis]|uniref:GNAT family N-acetyltransferase n=1 Tax=Psychroserpens damuponensis TaxID=943936 RepID=UPI000590145B|nr:GNAT family N-acetyltransferase [Psychroserpens damuponensis]